MEFKLYRRCDAKFSKKSKYSHNYNTALKKQISVFDKFQFKMSKKLLLTNREVEKEI